MKADSSIAAVQPLRFLPRDKKTLDFILKKLTVNSSPARYEMLQELLEMHRTSVGFDPFVLSKGRFKRFRSSEIKQVLAEIEQDLIVILSSGEYLQFLEESTRHQALFEQYTNIVSMLTAPPSRELNEQVDQFVAQLEEEGAHELLLSFFRQANKHFLNRSKSLEKVIETYSSLLVKLDLHTTLTLSGYQTEYLIQQALRGKATQEKLLLHFNCLSGLLGKTGDNTQRFELLHQIIRIGLHLDHRILHIAPFLKLITDQPDAVKLNDLSTRFELLTNSFIYSTTQSIPDKINNLELLAEEAKTFDDKQSLVYIKYGKALLHAAAGNYTDAIRILNEAEHLLYRNGFRSNAKKAWVEICFLRFYIYIINEQINAAIYEDTAYDAIVQMLRDALAENASLNSSANGLSGVKEFIKKNFSQAEHYLTMATDEKKNALLKHNHIIFTSLLLIATDAMNLKKVNKLKEELVALKEPFYSTFLTELLKN